MGIGVLVLFLVVAHFTKEWPLIIGGTVGFLYCLFYPKRSYFRHIRKTTEQLYREGRDKGLLGEREIEFAEDGIIFRSEVEESKHKWEGIEKIVTIDDYTFVYVNPISAYILPRSKIIDGDYGVFVQAIKEKFEKTQT